MPSPSPAPSTLTRAPQPPGFEGVKFSLGAMTEVIAKARSEEKTVAWARRVQRDAGYPQDPVGQAKAIWQAMREQNIRWVSDPVRSEFIAAVHHFAPSDAGKDDAFLVAGDCDELTCITAGLYVAAVQAAANIESCAILGHAYDGGKNISHVLAAVHDGRQWIRVDPTGDWGFGDFKRPTHEILISVPSGQVICSATDCAMTPPHRPTDPIEHQRLSGLPRGTSDGRLAGMPSDAGTLGAFSYLGDAADMIGTQTFAESLLGQQSDLAEACEQYTDSRIALTKIWELADVPQADREAAWPASQDTAAAALLDAAGVLVKAMQDVLDGVRRYALTDTGDFAIELLPTDTEQVLSTGDVAPVLHGLPPPNTLGLHPVLIGALVALGFVVVAGGYYTVCKALQTYADMAATEERRQTNAALAKCAETNDPSLCAKLGQSIAQANAARDAAVADQKKADAEKTQAIVSGVGYGTVAVVAAVGAVVAWQTGALELAAVGVRRLAAKVA